MDYGETMSTTVGLNDHTVKMADAIRGRHSRRTIMEIAVRQLYEKSISSTIPPAFHDYMTAMALDMRSRFKTLNIQDPNLTREFMELTHKLMYWGMTDAD